MWLAGVVRVVKRLDEVLVKGCGILLAEELCAEHLPEQTEGGIFFAVFAYPRVRLMMVKGTVPDVKCQSVKILGNRKYAMNGNIRLHDAQQRSAEHVVRMEFASVRQHFVGADRKKVSERHKKQPR